MPPFMMDCYYRSSPATDPVLRESVAISSPARSIAIAEAQRYAHRLLPDYFELRDLSSSESQFYTSTTE